MHIHTHYLIESTTYTIILANKRRSGPRGVGHSNLVRTGHIPDRGVVEVFHEIHCCYCAPMETNYLQTLRLPGFVFGAAELLEIATVAFGFAGVADLAAVMD